jgi:hypothetical protein
MDERDKKPVTVVHIMKPDATFTVELPERAVRALAVIGAFGEHALEKAVAAILSPAEAREHSYGFSDLARIGDVARLALERLSDARDVADGHMLAVGRAKAPNEKQ